MPIAPNQLRDILQQLGYSTSGMEASEPGWTIAMPAHGESRKVATLLEQNGELLHLSCLVSYCDGRRPCLPDVLRALAAFNLRNRTVRLGWDAGRGAIMACADLWLTGEPSPVRSIEFFLQRYQLEIEACGPVARSAVLGQDSTSPNVLVEIDDDMI
jgi:hypothetical protein